MTWEKHWEIECIKLLFQIMCWIKKELKCNTPVWQWVLEGSNCHRNIGLNCAGPNCLKAWLFKGPIVYRPDCAGQDCAGSDSVGPDCAGPDRTCTPLLLYAIQTAICPGVRELDFAVISFLANLCVDWSLLSLRFDWTLLFLRFSELCCPLCVDWTLLFLRFVWILWSPVCWLNPAVPAFCLNSVVPCALFGGHH